jgi:putative spermidine/putrescine transport system substrate-binding protein
MRAAKAGLVTPIDTARVPNLKDTINGTLTPGGSGVAVLFDSVDIMVNTDVYKGRITSWMDLWNPDLKGKLILPSSGISTAVYLLISIVRAMGGKEENEKDVDAAFRKLAELKPNVRTFFSEPIQPTQILERGEAGVAPQFGIRIAALAKSSKNIARMSPKEGQVAIGYDWVIAKGAKDPAAAHRFIDMSLAQPQQVRIAETLNGTPSRRNLPLSDAAKAVVLTDISKLIFVDEDFVAAQQRAWLQRWSREVQG